METITESAKMLPVSGHYDFIVCGGGPAGVAAAVSAGRRGLRTLLLEEQGCLGGIWTAGQLSLILDVAGKGGLLAEIKAKLERAEGARQHRTGPDFTYDVEIMKVLLDELCTRAGVDVQFHTRVVGVMRSNDRITHVVTESHSGREAFAAALFADCTGNGDLARYAGCAFEMGEPGTGRVQAATLFGLIGGVPPSEQEAIGAGGGRAFQERLHAAGVTPSYQSPSLFMLPNPHLCCLMVNHEYGVRCDDRASISRATMRARRELHTVVNALRRLPGWEQVRLVGTASHLGLREGRRIRGLYQLSRHDIAEGRRFVDGVCLVRFPVDIHALTADSQVGYHSAGIRVKPYHIPYRALVAEGVANLALAGRLISGDFHAHASYRVTGNATAMGEAVGIASSLAKREESSRASFAAVDGREVHAAMRATGYEL